MKFYTYLIASLILLSSSTCWSYGKLGHRMVAQLAENQLPASVRRGLAEEFSIPSLVWISDWADFMRSSPEEFWRDSGSWHYVTVPDGAHYQHRANDAADAFQRFQKQLLDTTLPQRERSRALKILVHLIADLHQPLHVGNGLDAGGNQHSIRFFGARSNLHRLWDSQLLEFQGLSYTEYATLLELNQQAYLLPETPCNPQIWIANSQVIRDQLYPAPDKVSYDYVFKFKHTLEQQIITAGRATAACINQWMSEG